MPMNRYPSSHAVIETDEDALKLLPPYALARNEYQAHRAKGETPQVAFQATLELWRELRQLDRPTVAVARPQHDPL